MDEARAEYIAAIEMFILFCVAGYLQVNILRSIILWKLIKTLEKIDKILDLLLLQVH